LIHIFPVFRFCLFYFAGSERPVLQIGRISKSTCEDRCSSLSLEARAHTFYVNQRNPLSLGFFVLLSILNQLRSLPSHYRCFVTLHPSRTQKHPNSCANRGHPPRRLQRAVHAGDPYIPFIAQIPTTRSSPTVRIQVSGVSYQRTWVWHDNEAPPNRKHQ
jgi:hypothetical protein